MAKRAALVDQDTGTVVNVIMLDDDDNRTEHDGLSIVIDERAIMGSTWNGTDFVPVESEN